MPDTLHPAVLVLLGLYWLVTGSIVIPFKGIAITGLPARIGAVMWIITAVSLALPRKK